MRSNQENTRESSSERASVDRNSISFAEPMVIIPLSIYMKEKEQELRTNRWLKAIIAIGVAVIIYLLDSEVRQI
ncbi:hypothetical protein GE061_004825 [Apolygus lucorum]|uniref:Uncharacterized protein n=1 Tax=Apolygus lucorum TaxID=248454 RepID=A0A8S9X2W8_APOLU|nr:hypothetical protein GE061_004825 [Apolygus lucorum]